MAEIRQLAHPPIHEAVIDIMFASKTPMDQETLEQLALPFLSEGGDKVAVGTYEAQLRPVEDELEFEIKVEQSKKTVKGLVVRNPSGRHFGFQLDRVSVSQSGNYTNWESLRDDAERAFSAVVAASELYEVNRVAARFINRIPLPSKDFVDFSELLVRPPALPPKLRSGIVTDFSDHQVIKGIEGEYQANFRVLTVGPVEGEQVNSLAIDVDVFTTAVLKPNFQDVLTKLDEIRVIKNQLFFGSITESALRNYQ